MEAGERKPKFSDPELTVLIAETKRHAAKLQHNFFKVQVRAKKKIWDAITKVVSPTGKCAQMPEEMSRPEEEDM